MSNVAGDRKTGEMCADLIGSKIEQLKTEGVNICCVITDSGSDFKKARKLLADRYKVFCFFKLL